VLKHLKIPVHVCAVDESHTIKNPNAAVTKEMLANRDLFKKRLALTGTPIGNHVFDLWAQLEFLYPGCSGFTEFAAFKKYFSRPIPQNATTEEKLECLQNLPMLREILARNAFIVTKKVALPYLPEKLFDVVSIPLSKRQQSAYDTLAENLALSIAKDLEDAEHGDKNRNLVINNVLTKSLKLTQITSGFIKWDAEKHPVTLDEIKPSWNEEYKENPKVDWLIEEVLASPKDEKFIVWCYQTFAQDIILRRLRERGIGIVRFNGSTPTDERTKVVDEFNDEILKTNPNAYDPLNSPTKVFLGNPRAAGPGLGGQRAGGRRAAPA
jgi:SNF2 family DNA or RNA helicase